MGRSMAHIAHQPGPMRVEGNVSRRLADWPGWWFWGVELHQRRRRLRYRVVVDYGGGPLSHRGRGGCQLFRGSWRVCGFGKTASWLAVCGFSFSWLLRVIDHEADLLDPKLFLSLGPRSVVLLKRRFGRHTSSRWLFSRKNDWVPG